MSIRETPEYYARAFGDAADIDSVALADWRFFPTNERETTPVKRRLDGSAASWVSKCYCDCHAAADFVELSCIRCEMPHWSNMTLDAWREQNRFTQHSR